MCLASAFCSKSKTETNEILSIGALLLTVNSKTGSMTVYSESFSIQ